MIKRLGETAVEEMTDTRRRVKLYALNADRQWDDRGTGHVFSSYVDRLKGMSLLVRAESDVGPSVSITGSLLLESKIQPDTAYQKQQDTLIVWSEGDNFDLALSFQEKAGCDEIWEKICQVQGKDPSVDITQDTVEESEDERFDDTSDSAPVELPPCELGRLEEISEVAMPNKFVYDLDMIPAQMIRSCLTSPMRKDKLALALESEGYIRKLLSVFRTCEDLENTEGLHHLYTVFKNIFMVNKNALFEVMFAEDTIFDVVGCLEYDPASPTPKRHREYLRNHARFKEVVPITNPELLAKIHQTYRVQYIQDVVLPTPSVIEENILSTLSSFIFFNKVEIVTLIQDDDKFLNDVFVQLMDETISEEKRRDLVMFLKEFCNFSQNLQPQGKEAFYKCVSVGLMPAKMQSQRSLAAWQTLSTLGILPALEITLGCEDQQTKAAAIDILTHVVEFSPSVVRAYTLQQANSADEDQLLLNVIIEQMICDSDPELGGAVQLMGVLRILLDPENMLASINKSEKTDFLNYFYKHSIHVLIAPLLSNTASEEGPLREDYGTAQLLALVLELLAFCVEHHTYHVKNCILNKDLLRALRFMRKIIALKDEFYNRYIIKGNLFAPVVDAFLRNNSRYNLLDSAILELFEFIKLEDIKSLWLHVVEQFGKVLDEVDYVQTFKALRVRYEQHQDKMRDRERTSLDGVPSILRNSRYRRDPRQLEEEEDMWFNEDDDFEDPATAPVGTQPELPGTPPSPSETLLKKLTGSPNADSELDSIGKLMDRKVAAEVGPGAKLNTGTGLIVMSKSSPATGNLLNNNSNSPTQQTSPPGSPGDPKSSSLLFKKGLVDYEGDSDEEEEEEEEVVEEEDGGSVTAATSADLVSAPAAKRARLS
ncbi:hypothetical protein B566_EDAN002246 [Ephemera danica]|nr:hypothetical protein B566_EDAN002246 [Ephemera danica]